MVFDAKTGDDLTHSVLTQIIVEQESRAGHADLLPIPFLRQLIRFYGDSVERLVPSYLQISLDTLTNEQDRFRKHFRRRVHARRARSRPTRSRRARTWRCSSRRWRCSRRSRASPVYDGRTSRKPPLANPAWRSPAGSDAYATAGPSGCGAGRVEP